MSHRGFLASCLAAGLIAAAAPHAHAEEQMSWMVNSYPSDISGDADTVILTYGIPETDAVAFEAICGGPDGAVPQAVFWYDTVDLAEDQDVVLSLSADGIGEEVPAKVYGKDAEVGVSGLRALLNTTSPVWQAMENDGVLAYGIAGGKNEKLHLTGASSAVQRFTAACEGGARLAAENKSMAGQALVRDPTARTTGAAVASSLMAAAAVEPEPEGRKAEAVSCTEFGKIRSARSEAPVKMTFVNNSDGYRGLLWIDTEGTPIDNTGLNQGESVVVPTFQTHVWMITDGPGNCIEMVVADATDTTFVITAPSPAFGPEND